MKKLMISAAIKILLLLSLLVFLVVFGAISINVIILTLAMLGNEPRGRPCKNYVSSKSCCWLLLERSHFQPICIIHNWKYIIVVQSTFVHIGIHFLCHRELGKSLWKTEVRILWQNVRKDKYGFACKTCHEDMAWNGKSPICLLFFLECTKISRQ